MSETIIILKREFILPEFWVLCSLNNWYSKLVEKSIIKLYKKIPNLKIVSDVEFFPMLNREKIPYVRFSEYVPKVYKPTTTYDGAIELFERWFSKKPLNELKYKEYSIGTVIREEFMYSMTEYVKAIDIIQDIIKKEKPNKVIVINDKTLFGNACKSICGQKRIKFARIITNLTSLPAKRLSDFLDYSLKWRFLNLPMMRRKEFVKTKEAKKKLGEDFLLINCPYNFYYDRLKVVINEAKSRGINIKAAINDTLAQKKAEKEKTGYFSVGDYFAYSKELDLFKKELSRIWKSLIRESENRNFFSYDGLDIFSIVGGYLKYLFKIRFLWCAYYLESYENLFKKNKIKAVILMSDLAPIDNSLVLVAKRYGVLSLIAPHGALIEKRSFYPLTADKSMVWGRIMKKQMEGFGIPPERIVITGPYVFDNFVKKRVYARHLLKQFGIGKKDFVILLCTQKFEDVYYEKEVEETIKMTVKAVEGMPDTKVIITIHPREFPYVHEAVLKEMGMQGKIPVVKQDINELLSIADVMVGSFSTTTFNAVLYKKPMIYLNPIKRHKIFPVVESKAAISALNKEELAKIIGEIRSGKHLKESKKYGKKFFKDYCYRIDGKASKRIIDFTMKTIKAKSNHY